MFTRLVVSCLKWLALAAASLAALVWGWFSVAGRSAPDRDQMAAMMRSGEVVRDRVGDGFELKCLLPLTVSAADVSPKLRAVLLGAEDRGFATEPFGLSLRGLAGAVSSVLHGRARGGSTVAQQLVKNLMFEPGDRPLVRKFYEIPWAVKLSRRFTRDEVLGAYLNHLPFQHGIFGVEAASRFYFGKPASDLGYREAALIEVMLASPRNDLASRDPAVVARTRERARTLLAALVRQGVVPAAALHERERRGTLEPPDLGCGYLRDYVAAEAKRMGAPDGAWRAYVTVDAARQGAAVAALDGARDRMSAAEAGQAAFVGLDRAGAVQAFMGGTDYAADQFDRAERARRSPGSLGKVIVLAEACEQGLGLDATVDDAPQPGGRPKDDDGRYLGPIRLGDAFRLSRNAAMFGLERALGRGAVAARARLLGLAGPLPEDGGIAVGEFSASPLAMTAMLAGIANGGYPVEPHAVRGIVGHYGRIVAWHRDVLPKPALSARCVALLDSALRSVVAGGTGRHADFGEARGKTGTTNAFRDAWFVGYAGSMVAGVWLGNDDDRGMAHVEGGGLPAELFRSYLLRYARALAPTRPPVAKVAAGW
ncbi:transglycosylase domain-containing protein [Lichenibacterium dinghuense]|uniref:transglycosylase domain-containing protein n=1 Tax=Lichenibacterium dinghuense TaxID=2895977 RepID=UPI001F2BC751|nr:transglycosylase domain-containing protein [Lichenibacterium sp. 6Y81]